MSSALQQWQRDFLQHHQLDESYIPFAERWFEAVIPDILEIRSFHHKPVLVAVNGCQGSGKSTLCDYLVACLKYGHQCSAVSLSLDDFYLPQEQRRELAKKVHPLLATRGVPGTHDIALLETTLDNLCSASVTSVTAVPRFDKAIDDRRPRSKWDSVVGAVEVIFFEGWCLGAEPENGDALSRSVNALEAVEDAEGHWRRYVNRVLQDDFQRLYERFDLWFMLQAPSFDCVYRWRLEQETKLASQLGKSSGRGVMGQAEIARFIQFYQRLTESCLRDLPGKVNYLYQLGQDREVLSFEYRSPAKN